MKVLTAEDLGIAIWEGIESPADGLALPSPRPQNAALIVTERQEAFLRDRFGIKLEHPQTGHWIRSWRAEE